jgi:peptidyl-prolyl cis-trans isomerase A (cyclophilin A)
MNAWKSSRVASCLFASLLALPLLACGSSSTTGGGGGGSGQAGGSGPGGGNGPGGGGSGGAVCGDDPAIKPQVLPDTTDPEHGMFTMDQALAGLPEGPGPLRAIIDTDLGTLTCELYPDKAPIGVANFVGLARGVRPWLDPATMKWVKRRFYDGLLFHRVIPTFVAQGGDPLGTGVGGPGYTFGNEISDLKHVAGSLAYANTGQLYSNGSQYYVCEEPQPALDGKYTIFGLCTPETVIKKLTHVPTDGDPPAGNDRPLTPLHMKTITITRCAE